MEAILFREEGIDELLMRYHEATWISLHLLSQEVDLSPDELHAFRVLIGQEVVLYFEGIEINGNLNSGIPSQSCVHER